jgi:hypothetical protein
MAESNPIQPPESVPEDAMDALYGLPLEEFTPRRDELSKELRAGGEREAAAWVKALRKPTAAAWLVNQLARTQRADAQRLLDSAESLRRVQEQILAGGGGAGDLSRASVEHEGAMRALLKKAPGLLNREGVAPSDATLERASDTLRAIALDDDARAAFAAGRLAREQRASGLGFAPDAASPPRRKRGAVRQSEPEPSPSAKERERARAAVDAAKARHRAAREAVAERGRALRQAEREAQTAQRRVDKAEAALARAREKEERAAAQVEQAQSEAQLLDG